MSGHALEVQIGTCRRTDTTVAFTLHDGREGQLANLAGDDWWALRKVLERIVAGAVAAGWSVFYLAPMGAPSEVIKCNARWVVTSPQQVDQAAESATTWFAEASLHTVLFVVEHAGEAFRSAPDVWARLLAAAPDAHSAVVAVTRDGSSSEMGGSIAIGSALHAGQLVHSRIGDLGTAVAYGAEVQAATAQLADDDLVYDDRKGNLRTVRQ